MQSSKVNIEGFLKPRRYINCSGRLVDMTTPLVMGILNSTPDSFYVGSRFVGETQILNRVKAILEDGGTIVDVGAYSTRPGAVHISELEEKERLMPVLGTIRNAFPEVVISVDTFRSEVARMAIEDGSADIINDISGGEMDPEMFDLVASLKVPYVLMHMQGSPQTMQDAPTYKNVVADVLLWLAKKVDDLRQKGVADIIIDPGFGFGKNLDHNYELLSRLEAFSLFELPLLVGVSRKSMIYRFLDETPETALNGTTVLNTLALTKGASILRVHDVKEAVECVKIVDKCRVTGS
jgi:dihydropteroate synthase